MPRTPRTRSPPGLKPGFCLYLPLFAQRPQLYTICSVRPTWQKGRKNRTFQRKIDMKFSDRPPQGRSAQREGVGGRTKVTDRGVGRASKNDKPLSTKKIGERNVPSGKKFTPKLWSSYLCEILPIKKIHLEVKQQPNRDTAVLLRC